jgi:hypothetical protein
MPGLFRVCSTPAWPGLVVPFPFHNLSLCESQLGSSWTSNRAFGAYQSRVLIVGYSYEYFAARDLARMGACLTVVEFLVLLLLVPFYWPLIGLK